MAKIRGIALAGFVCFVSVLASADSISNIPITGDATKGFVQTVGDFNIQGPSLGLFQGLPEGGNSIGLCSVGTVCDFSYSIGNATTFCQYCTGYSSGFLGNKVASFLDASLLFTGSAFYSGSAEDFQIMQVPMTLAGTIIGYTLVDCSDGVVCSLGPVQFALHIVGQGTGQFYLQPDGNIYGGITSFSGTATVVAEPMSLVLTGTGLVGIWARRKIAQSK
jgi:hypothetical protein